jgi:hypothetical protein
MKPAGNVQFKRRHHRIVNKRRIDAGRNRNINLPDTNTLNLPPTTILPITPLPHIDVMTPSITIPTPEVTIPTPQVTIPTPHVVQVPIPAAEPVAITLGGVLPRGRKHNRQQQKVRKQPLQHNRRNRAEAATRSQQYEIIKGRQPPHGNEAMYVSYLKMRVGNRLFSPPSAPLTTDDNKTVVVNICIPLWNRAEHIKGLLINLQNIINNTQDKNVKVWIADFHSTDIDLNMYIKQFTYPIEIVLHNGPFIIAKGLQNTAEKMPLNEIVYFTDADAFLPNEIFNRIRTYTIQGKQFYCPMVAYQEQNNTLWLPPAGKDHGGKGHIGVFLSDFKLCNGWKDKQHLTAIPIKGPGPMERLQWGGHDGHLYNKLRWDQLNVYRPRENDQWVKYHIRNNNEWNTNGMLKRQARSKK